MAQQGPVCTWSIACSRHVTASIFSISLSLYMTDRVPANMSSLWLFANVEMLIYYAVSEAAAVNSTVVLISLLAMKRRRRRYKSHTLGFEAPRSHYRKCIIFCCCLKPCTFIYISVEKWYDFHNQFHHRDAAALVHIAKATSYFSHHCHTETLTLSASTKTQSDEVSD